MKKLSITVLFTVGMICLYGQDYFMYYGEKKQYFEVSPNKILVQFVENTDTNSVRNIIARNTSCQISDIKKTDCKDLHIVSFFGTDTSKTKKLVKQWKNKDAILYSGPVFIDEYGEEIAALTNQIIVCLKQEIDYPVLQQSIELYMIDTIRQDEFNSKVYLLSLNYASEKDAMQVANELHETGLFEFVEPDLLLFIKYAGNVMPNDTYFPDQWGLLNTGQYGGIPGVDINATQAWNITTGDPNIIISIIDDGIDVNHPDLADNLLSVWGGQGGEHGTACAGIAAGRGNNSIGISGVAPNCRILSAGVGSIKNVSDVANAVDWSIQNGAKVISMSFSIFGSPLPADVLRLELAFSNAINSGCVLVASTGNNNNLRVNYPSSLPNVISVGAISPCGERKSPTSCDTETGWGSNYGTMLDVMAPGVLISTTDIQGYLGYNPNEYIHINYGGSLLFRDYPDRNYTVWFCGTSAACPHVAGVAALMLSVNPNLNVQQVRDIIERTSRKVRSDLYTYTTTPDRNNGAWNNEMGYGLVNAYAAVHLAAYGIIPTLLIKDNEEDDATEPNPTKEAIWNSPDIWVRNVQDSCKEHQNPISNTDNFIYVRVKNRACFPSKGGENLIVYWAKADPSLEWDFNWIGNTFPQGQLMGNVIDTIQIPSIPANGEILLEIPWWHYDVPVISYYNNIANNPHHFYLLARIEDANVPILVETSDLYGNVKNNNKIAWKHVYLEEIHDIRTNLIIRDTEDDTGAEPNPTGNKVIWNSPEIWVRYTNDNGIEHQNPIPNTTNFIYVRIKNMSNYTFQGDAQLQLFWSRAAISPIWTEHWNRAAFPHKNQTIGDVIHSLSIPCIPANDDTVLVIPWDVPDIINYCCINQTNKRGEPEDPAIAEPEPEEANKNPWHFCLLARIESEEDIMTYTETENIYANVRNNNNIAWKSLSLIGYDECNSVGAAVGIWSAYDWQYPAFHLEFKPDIESQYLINAEITVEMNMVLYDAWARGGFQGNEIEDIGNSTIRILGENAILRNIIFDSPYEFGLFDLHFNYLNQNNVGQAYHVIQIDAMSDKVIGGHTIQITEPSPYGRAANENEETYVDTNTNIEIKLNLNKIVSITPNPATDEITVAYELNEVKNAYIFISNYYFTGVYDNYVLDVTSRSRRCSVQTYATGFYIVTLVCDGKVADVKTFIKH